ncbi:glycosyltransferase family 2 protein [Candidatus Babeliales bacterium]|nr:glycosyltransferase family 2 protein [Candidatus Babeliales bacterium]
MISFVIPAFNEERNLPFLYERLCAVMKQRPYEFEMIIVNDGSGDATWDVIINLGTNDNRVKGINFSRNFGHQMALTAGYDCARGEAIISMDADLQDPPEVILHMIRKWEEGSDIVYARRLDRNDGLFKKLTASVYYKILDAVSDVRIPRNVGDFRLVSKRALDVLMSCREHARYLRGLVAWIGFKCAYVDFVRPNRKHGVSGYSLKKMFTLALDGLAGFSIFPMKIVGYIGLLILLGSGITLSYMMISALLFHGPYTGSIWLSVIILLCIGFQCVALWFLGEYVGRIYEEAKGRPLYIVSETINMNED